MRKPGRTRASLFLSDAFTAEQKTKVLAGSLSSLKVCMHLCMCDNHISCPLISMNIAVYLFTTYEQYTSTHAHDTVG